jgi:hypothetical protein
MLARYSQFTVEVPHLGSKRQANDKEAEVHDAKLSLLGAIDHILRQLSALRNIITDNYHKNFTNPD